MLPGHSPPCPSAFPPRVAAASASTLSAPRRSPPSSPACTERRRRMKLRSLGIVLLLLVRIRRKPFAFVLRRGRIVCEVTGSRRPDREIVGGSGAAAQLFQKLAEHPYRLAVRSVTTASATAAPKKSAASIHSPSIRETAA